MTKADVACGSMEPAVYGRFFVCRREILLLNP